MADDVRECLRGAGCPESLCAQAAELEEAGRTEELLAPIAAHRLRLLEELRGADERLACADRAIARIRSEMRS